jgi:acyl carrier protein
MNPSIDDISRLITEVGGVSGFGPDEDIYDAGFTSVRALDLLLELETRFGVSLPDDGFTAARSASALHTLVVALLPEGAAGG